MLARHANVQRELRRRGGGRSIARVLRLAIGSLALVAACRSAPAPARPRPPPGEPGTGPGEPTEGLETPRAPPRITWRHVAHADDVADPPDEGTWRVHLIDVGTGLAIFVEGADFSMLFDAGTSDPGEKPLRVVAYLAAVLGPSGDEECSETGAASKERRVIDHVVLSHPHQDHASALDLVLHCFDVRNVWDSGRVNDAAFYRDFVRAVAHDRGAAYHTAAIPPKDRAITVKGDTIVMPPDVAWTSFGEGDTVALGDRASFEILHAEAKAHEDPNQNSIVLAVALGDARLLLTGDAESGPREDPSAALGDVEEHLVDHFAREIDADILQVGHHGSLTSSRRAFLTAVSPSLALVSAGPKLFRSVRLPDAAVLEALADVGATVLRTDEHDDTCPLAERIGADRGPGGCDSYVITIGGRAEADGDW